MNTTPRSFLSIVISITVVPRVRVQEVRVNHAHKRTQRRSRENNRATALTFFRFFDIHSASRASGRHSGLGTTPDPPCLTFLDHGFGTTSDLRSPRVRTCLFFIFSFELDPRLLNADLEGLVCDRGDRTTSPVGLIVDREAMKA